MLLIYNNNRKDWYLKLINPYVHNMVMLENSKQLISLINMCREEKDIGKRCQILNYINYLVPVELRVSIPSIISHDCIDQILSSMEEKISPPIYELTYWIKIRAIYSIAGLYLSEDSWDITLDAVLACVLSIPLAYWRSFRMLHIFPDYPET